MKEWRRIWREMPGITSILLIILLTTCQSVLTYGQCSFTGPLPIPDPGVSTVTFQVDGLTDSDLASPTQGVCGVEIHFLHEYVGDLTVTLVSPAGTSVTLVGPVTSAITPTNLAQWNIEFIPCGSSAMPDAGFSAIWNNEQPWAAIGMYSGDYHPSSGCLEDFNVGSANGTWQVIFEDHSQFQLGSISSVSLVFCNENGLDCATCTANGGVLSPSSFQLCSGENFESDDIAIDFQGNEPPTADYAYVYMLINGNTIEQYGSNFVSTLLPGNYLLCGMSYFRGDENTVNALLSAGDYDLIQQSLQTSIFCGDISDNCIPINVTGPPDTIDVEGTICMGDNFVYGGTSYNAIGTYYQSIDGPGMCDTIAEIRVIPGVLNVATTQDEVINCGDNDVTLNATVSGTNAPISYLWETNSGNINSNPTLSSIQVDQSGLYTIEVTDGICNGNGSSEVLAGPGFPQVIVSGGTITCTRTVIPLRPVFVPLDAIIQWTDPLGGISNLPDLDATIPGTYILSVTNQDGCTTTRPVEILIDTITAPVTIIQVSKDCENMQARLNIQTTLNVVSRLWTGPNGFNTPTASPTISDPGLYQVEVVFNNGCRRTATFMFDGDFAIPDISVPMQDTINCNEEIILTIQSATPGVSYGWMGPNGLSSNLASITIDQAGFYFATVHAVNDCRARDTVEIVKGDDIFDFTVFTDTLDCNQDTAVIGVIAPDADMFHWDGITTADSSSSTIRVTTPGIYHVEMTNSLTGCIVNGSVQVYADFAVSSFGFISDTITCQDPVAELNFVPFANFTYTSIYWILPDQTIVPGQSIMSGMPGEHRLIAEGPNGCEGTWRIHIPFDTLPPVVLLEYDSIGCDQTISLTARSVGNVVSYQWSGPGIISQNNGIAQVDEPGEYIIHVVGENGCETIQSITVDSNYISPSYVLEFDPIQCDADAILIATHDNVLNQINWLDPLGNSIGSTDTVYATIPGQYIFIITGPNQCTEKHNFELESPPFPVVSAVGDTIQCDEPIADLFGTVDIIPSDVFWVDPNGDTISRNLTAQTSIAGNHELFVTGPNGCVSSFVLDVQIDTVSPIANIEMIGELRCQMRDFELDASSSVELPLLYEWSTMAGNIVSDSDQPLIMANDTGAYQLIVTQIRNGCKDTTVMIVGEHPESVLGVELNITPASCSGDENAIIEIMNVLGGVSPFTYSLDGTVPQLEGYFDQLGAGTYLLSLEDDEGCAYDTIVTINATGPYGVQVGEDAEIFIGESFLLTGEHNLPDSLQFGVIWSIGDSILCDPCLEFEVSPLETTTYIFSVGSTTNCLRSDTITIYVIEEGKFIVPNVFTPNGDGINEIVAPSFGVGVEEVLRWVVFDRWGQAVYGKTNYQPDDPTVGWDGTNSVGQRMNPAVFAYILEFRLINGRIELHHGDITLIR